MSPNRDVMLDYRLIRKPDLLYRYEFAPDELEAAKNCLDEHGFAVLKRLLPVSVVLRLQETVRDVVDGRSLGPRESRTHISFIEEAPTLYALFDYEPFMAVHRFFSGGDEMTLNRSAAIVRNPGSTPVGWHTDWRGFSKAPPKDSGDVLNRGPWLSGKWLYLTGSRPVHGGLAVIADSHRIDWEGPDGFTLSADRRFFYPKGSVEQRYCDFDVPGTIPLFTEPGDQILFATRTYHAAFPNQTDQQRLSCGVGFRHKAYKIVAPWKLSGKARAFIAALPQRHQKYVEEYTGIDQEWRGNESAHSDL